ncbi:MAG: hypothetical protein JXA60_08005 [Candidatus Coatesbacteria bacterium]|nr:hypothetical protein [Candidatus Coatesbacteria bacterium]
MLKYILFLFLSFTLLYSYEELSVQKSNLGTTYILRLKSGPWSFKSSMNKVAIFIPKYYKKFSWWDALIHFHGHNCSMEYALKGYELREQLFQSKQNAILIIPNLDGSSNSGELMKKDGLKKFILETGSFLVNKKYAKKINPRIIVISSHSGGYKPMAYAIKNGGIPIREVIMFDSQYGEEDTFVKWLKEHKARRYLNLIGPSTKSSSKKVMNLLKKEGISFKTAKEGELQRKVLTKTRIVFLETKQGHNQCLSGYCNYRDYLFRSALKRYIKTDWFEGNGLDKK